MVLFGELGKAEAMELRVAEVLFGEDLALILHALRIVHHFAHVARLHLLTLVLLRDDVLLHTFIDNRVIVTDLLLRRRPILHRSHHLAARHNQVLVVLRGSWWSARVQPLLVVSDQRRHGIRRVGHVIVRIFVEDIRVLL